MREVEFKKFDYQPSNQDRDEKIRPVAEAWGQKARREQFRGLVPEMLLDTAIKPFDIIEDDSLLYNSGDQLVLTDAEISLLNILLEQPYPVSTPWLQEHLPFIDLPAASRLLIAKDIITNDALSPSVHPALAKPAKRYETKQRPRRRPSDEHYLRWKYANTWQWSIHPRASFDDRRYENILPADLNKVREQLALKHFAILDDEILGEFGTIFRTHLLDGYFNNPSVVRAHEHDVPRDRKRARAVARVAFLDSGTIISGQDIIYLTQPGVYLGEHTTNAVHHNPDPAIIRPKEYSKIEIFKDPWLLQFISHLNELIPEQERALTTTFGINAFRTHSDVVSKPHQDGVNYVVVYVVDIKGNTPRTRLYPIDHISGTPNERPKISKQLQPGQLIIFKDSQYRHYTSALTSYTSEDPQRDVMVFTADYPS